MPTLNPFAPSPDAGGGEDDAFLEPGASVAQIKNPTNPVNVTPVSNDANVNTNAGEEPGRHNETSIAVNPTNPLNMVGSMNDIELAVNPAGHVTALGVSRVRYTRDGGKSWTAVALVSNEYNFTGDPALSFDANGTVYLATLGFRYNGGSSPTGIQPDILVARSTDGGQTWSKQVRVATGTGSFFTPGRGQDKEFITAWGNGNAIVTWTQFNQAQKGAFVNSPLYSSVTHDGGKTWSAPTLISGDLPYNQGSVPTVAADGSIYVAFLSYVPTDPEADANGFRDHYMVVKLNPQTGAPVGAPVDVGRVYDGIYDYPFSEDGRPTYQDSQFRTWPVGNITADPTNAKHLAVVWATCGTTPTRGVPPTPTRFADPTRCRRLTSS